MEMPNEKKLSGSEDKLTKYQTNRVSLETSGGIITKVEFAKDKDDLDKKYRRSTSVERKIFKDQNIDNKIDNWVARHIIPKRVIMDYWEHHLKKMTLEDANKELDARLKVLIRERNSIETRKNMKETIATTLPEKIDQLMRLELTSPINIFYGPNVGNASQGGGIGGIRSGLLNDGEKEQDYAQLAKRSLDLADDEKTQTDLISINANTKLLQSKIENAQKRDEELKLTKLYFQFIKNHPLRHKRYPIKPEFPEHEKGNSRPSSPHHEKSNAQEALLNDNRIKYDFEHYMQSFSAKPPEEIGLDGNNILHHAAMRGNDNYFLIALLQVIETKTNIDINKINEEEKTPLDLAIERGYEASIPFLLKYGARTFEDLSQEAHQEMKKDIGFEGIFGSKRRNEQKGSEEEDEFNYQGSPNLLDSSEYDEKEKEFDYPVVADLRDLKHHKETKDEKSAQYSHQGSPDLRDLNESEEKEAEEEIEDKSVSKKNKREEFEGRTKMDLNERDKKSRKVQLQSGERNIVKISSNDEVILDEISDLSSQLKICFKPTLSLGNRERVGSLKNDMETKANELVDKLQSKVNSYHDRESITINEKYKSAVRLLESSKEQIEKAQRSKSTPQPNFSWFQNK